MSNKIAFGKEVLYYYYSREDSITGLPFNRKKLDILDAYENRLDFYMKHKEKALYDRECQYYLSEILANYYKVSRYLHDKTLLGELRRKYNEVYRTSDKASWTVSRKGMYFVFKLFPIMYGTLKNRGH